MRRLIVALFAIPAIMAMMVPAGIASPPDWPEVKGYPQIDLWIWRGEETPDWQPEPVNENPDLYLDPEAEPNDNWPGNPSFDWDLGPVPDSELKNPDYLESGGEKPETPYRGDCAVWPWETIS